MGNEQKANSKYEFENLFWFGRGVLKAVILLSLFDCSNNAPWSDKEERRDVELLPALEDKIAENAHRLEDQVQLDQECSPSEVAEALVGECPAAEEEDLASGLLKKDMFVDK